MPIYRVTSNHGTLSQPVRANSPEEALVKYATAHKDAEDVRFKDEPRDEGRCLQSDQVGRRCFLPRTHTKLAQAHAYRFVPGRDRIIVVSIVADDLDAFDDAVRAVRSDLESEVVSAQTPYNAQDRYTSTILTTPRSDS